MLQSEEMQILKIWFSKPNLKDELKNKHCQKGVEVDRNLEITNQISFRFTLQQP